MHHHLREHDDKRHHDTLDDHEGHIAPVDLACSNRRHPQPSHLVGIFVLRRNRAQIEQREAERRMHERCLHVHPEHHTEPNEVDAELVCYRADQRNGDEGELEEVEEEGEQEDQNVDEDQEARLAARQRRQQMLDPHMPAHAVEGEREHARADQNEHDEGRKLRGRFRRLTQQIP